MVFRGWVARSTADQVRIQVNNGSVDSASYNSGSYNSDGPFAIGAYLGFGNTQHWDGLIDEVGVWKRTLTTDERTALYNGGSGLTYPFVTGLTQDLVAYYKLDEASGTRNDSVGTAHLSVTDTVGSDTGKIGLAADFENSAGDSGNLLSVADTSALSMGAIDFTVAAWVWMESKAVFSGETAQSFVTKGDNDGFEYALEYYSTTDRFVFSAQSADGFSSGDAVHADSNGAPIILNWYFVVGWHINGDGLYIQVNNGAVDFNDMAVGCYDSDANFGIGAYPGFGVAQECDGLVDEVGIWKRVLTTEERTTLYNGGAGLTYPFTTATATSVLARRTYVPHYRRDVFRRRSV